MSAEKKPTDKNNKFARRLIEYTVIGASCLYLGVHAYKKFCST